MDGMKLPGDRLLKVKDVATMFCVSARQVWRMVAAGVLPQPVHVTARVRAWPESEIMAVLERMKARRPR